MNGQQTFSDIEYSMRKRTTKREAFLDAMDECIVWDEWCALIEPYYFKGKRGRPPTGCRIGEVLGLRSENLDFDNGVISINHSLRTLSVQGYAKMKAI